MLKDNLKDSLIEFIEDMNIDEQYEIFTEYCEKNKYYDDMPEPIEEFNDLCCGMSPLDIISEYGSFNVNCEYFYNSIYGVEEWEGIETNSTIGEVVNYIIKNDNDLYNPEIRKILDNKTKVNIDELNRIAYEIAIESYINEFCAYTEDFEDEKGNKKGFEELTIEEIKTIEEAIHENKIMFNVDGEIIEE